MAESSDLASSHPDRTPQCFLPIERKFSYFVMGSRVVAGSVVAVTIVFLMNFFLNYVLDWPGVPVFLAYVGGLAMPEPLDGGQLILAGIQFGTYAGSVLLVAISALLLKSTPIERDVDIYSKITAFIIRASFWFVFFVGISDALVSGLRVEGFLAVLIGDDLTSNFGLAKFRGQYLHLPLLTVSLLIALFTRSLSIVWLSLLIVIAEFLIVISRFVYSYEQAFMGDLVRFWYAALFLFASAYSLFEEGHVRVDVLYSNYSTYAKAWTNALGSLFLGIPFCWVILTMGLWSKESSIGTAILNFEISQSGYGMYVKYLMAAFLVIFALSMTTQFMAYFLRSVIILSRRGEDAEQETTASKFTI